MEEDFFPTHTCSHFPYSLQVIACVFYILILSQLFFCLIQL